MCWAQGRKIKGTPVEKLVVAIPPCRRTLPEISRRKLIYLYDNNLIKVALSSRDKQHGPLLVINPGYNSIPNQARSLIS